MNMGQRRLLMLKRLAMALVCVLLGSAPLDASLHQAVRTRDIEALDQLLQSASRREINEVERDGVTALHIAAAMGQVDIIDKLIQAGAEINKATGTGFTPLHWAVSRNQDGAVAALLAAGAAASPVANSGITPLHWAASRGNTALVAALIESGADIHALTESGHSPLHVALRRDAANPVAILLAEATAVQEIKTGRQFPTRRLPDSPEMDYDMDEDKDLDLADPDVVPTEIPQPERGTILSVSIGMGEEIEFVWIEQLGIWVGRYEITNGQFRRYNPRHDSGRYEGLSLNDARQPVARVTWYEAAAYSEWLSENFADRIPAGMHFRLPTNREWTIIASAGDGRRYPWGDEWPPRYGNYSDSSARRELSEWRGIDGYDDGFIVSAPVESSGMNEWGIYGLGGNVWEWMLDWFDETAQFKSRRGASWDFDRRESLAISWIGFDRPNVRYHNIGFRVVIAPR